MCSRMHPIAPAVGKKRDEITAKQKGGKSTKQRAKPTKGGKYLSVCLCILPFDIFAIL